MLHRPADLRALPRRLLLAALSILFTAASGARADDVPWRFAEVPGVVALSDIHGAHDAFLRALVEGGVVDDKGHWRAGGRHLIITGDLLDRGPDSRAAMDLLMRLEEEAAAAGGQVHVLLGNHEVMNLVGDLRYVSAGEYAAFAAEETDEERACWRERFIARALAAAEAEAEAQAQAQAAAQAEAAAEAEAAAPAAPESVQDVAVEARPAPDPATLAAQFERAHPPGFFAHRRAFRPDGVYGAWLLGKPMIVVVNDTVFVHGGVSPSVGALGLETVNRDLGEELDSYVRAVAALTDAGILHPGDSFYAHRKIVAGLPEGTVLDDAAKAAVATVMQDHEVSIHDQDGPAWYRGHAGCPAMLERDRLGLALAGMNAERIVIGHTPTVTRRIVDRIDERILEIDTGMLNEYYGGSAHALVLDRGDRGAVAEDGGRPDIDADPRPNGLGALSVTAIEAMLGGGEVRLGDERPDGFFDARVLLGERQAAARFFPDRKRRFSPEVAAWRLDRLLGVGLVPVTVRREVDGKHGALQLMPLGAITEEQRIAARSGAAAWCPLPAQWESMYVFDTLISKDVRTQQEILYDGEAFKLFLSGHGNAFGTRGGKPRYLKEVEVTVGPAWREALAALNAELLEAELGDVLDARQRRAVLKRRDELLAGD